MINKRNTLVWILLTAKIGFVCAQQDTVFTVIDEVNNVVQFETVNTDLSEDKGMLMRGVKHGNQFHYFPNGVLMGMMQFNNGKKEGVQLYFDKTGLLLKEENYRDNMLHGEMRSYYTANNVRILKQSQQYKNGKLDGLSIENNNEGKTISAEEFRAGIKNGRSIWFYNNGKPAMEQYYANGELDGKQVMYNMEGAIISTGQYTNGKKSGKWTTYYDNGQIKNEGNYSEDVKTGKWKYFDEAGKEMSEEND